jgi:hypothetical protein
MDDRLHMFCGKSLNRFLVVFRSKFLLGKIEQVLFVMGLKEIFIGAPQSKFAAISVLVAIAFIALAILVGKEPIPMGQRFTFILILFLVSLPGLLVTLFQLTCLVTGAGLKNQRWWCSLYAWIGSVLIILYSVILVVAAIMSLLQGTSLIQELAKMEEYKNANLMAKEMFENTTPVPPTLPPVAGPAVSPMVPAAPMVPKMEKFEDVPTMADMPTAPPTMPPPVEPFQSKNEMVPTGVAPMEPETFTSCGAPVPSSA